jgi:hypothetical protein
LDEAGDYSHALSYHRKQLEMRQKGSASAPQDIYLPYHVVIALADIAKMHAKLGERNAALEECSKARELLKSAVDEPTTAGLRTGRADTYLFLGGAYAALAELKKITS